MAIRFSISHRTEYLYPDSVSSSYNEVRMIPRQTESQRVLTSSISITPFAPVYQYDDYFGTKVAAFDLQGSHESLVISANSIVEVERISSSAGRLTRLELSEDGVRDMFFEYLTETPLTSISQEIRPAAEAITSGLDPEEAIFACVSWINERMEFEGGVTRANTTAIEALEIGKGVCQDFSHLCLAMLRSVGIPSRYVSGYLFPLSESERGLFAEGQSHAWVEAWIGGWRGFDPANGLLELDDRYITVGKGRDYLDVAPLLGIYTGTVSAPPKVSVAMSIL